jgi:hypothetical protein
MDEPEQQKSEMYNIHWLRVEDGRHGIGKKDFSLGEARDLCSELNELYPTFQHHPVLRQ